MSHTRFKMGCLALIAGIALLGTSGFAADADKAPVRQLKFKTGQASLPMGGTQVVLFADAKELIKGLEERIKDKFVEGKGFIPATPEERKAIAEKLAKELGEQVDFTKEQIAWVGWTTSGPPEGQLKHEIKDKEVIFYVQAPAANVRGQRARIGNDFFAVPAKLKAQIEKGERPAGK
ncbi:MAG: hypothetical protein K2R98_21330 [Gemmataceae bacterium]|nr:hypothetical protein [Gemmataceae bacterium]